ncbi:unnamed protein product [Lactuca saligna]|uniref:Uncharacterized protein n=1 Tax=Lactuca saligna TaxID=75948 RepID=A0AA35ZRU0_LACSI|nr:unnamed protein product [Lactuca saligna]
MTIPSANVQAAKAQLCFSSLKKTPANVQPAKAQLCFSSLYIRRWNGHFADESIPSAKLKERTRLFFDIHRRSFYSFLHQDRRFEFSFKRSRTTTKYILTKLNVLMETKGGKKSSSSSSSKAFYEAPLGYSIEDVRPNGGIKKFRSAAYSNCARKPS